MLFLSLLYSLSPKTLLHDPLHGLFSIYQPYVGGYVDKLGFDIPFAV